MISRRKDGRGHWPRDVRRGVEAHAHIARLARLTRTGRLSMRAAARLLGVHERTIRRWVAREDYPYAHHARKLARFVEDRQ
jgi:transposase-like protein